MDELTVQLSQLMTQRKALSFNFCCYKANNVNNTQKLLTIVRLIEQTSEALEFNKSLVSANSAKQIINQLTTESSNNKDEIAYVLSLKLILKPTLQNSLLPELLKAEQLWLQILALDIADILGDNLTFIFDFTQLNLGKNLFFEGVELNDGLLPHILHFLYYRGTLNDYLDRFFPSYKNGQERKSIHNNLSVLTWLYIDVLSDNNIDVQILTKQFIQCEYLDKPLFDLYIISLNETGVTQVINQLSVDENLIPYVIHAMALSGYVKFIPFIAQYLQQAAFALDAFKAIRLLLGDKLDDIIPLSVQFNSDNNERVNDLTYYGAKLLNAWQQRLPLLAFVFKSELNEAGDANENVGVSRLLNGSELSVAKLDIVLMSGSQWHRYVAKLHQQQFNIAHYAPHVHALEVC